MREIIDKKAETKLVKKAIGGNQAALNRLIESKFKDILYFTISNSNMQDAEDIAQEAVLHIFKDIGKLKDQEKFHAWMMSLVYHDCIDYNRGRRKDESLFLNERNDYVLNEYVEEMNMEFLPSEYVEEKEKRTILMEMIQTLPDNYRQCLYLSYFERLSYEEIGEVLGCRREKVRNDLHRAKALIKKRLEEREKRTFTYSVLPAGAVPVFTQAFRADQAMKVSPELTGLLWKQIQSNISPVKPGIMAKAAAGAGTVIVIGGVIIGYLSHTPKTAEVKEEMPAVVQEVVKEPEAVETEVPQEKPIETLEDMIGDEPAERLRNYEQQGTVNSEAWERFVEEIGAEMDMNSQEADHEYYTYLLIKQDKQLFLAQRKDKNSGESVVLFQFGSMIEVPQMFEVIMLFE